MPLSFFAEKKTRVFVCAGGTLKRNANDAKNANLRKMFARRGVLHTPKSKLTIRGRMQYAPTVVQICVQILKTK